MAVQSFVTGRPRPGWNRTFLSAQGKDRRLLKQRQGRVCLLFGGAGFGGGVGVFLGEPLNAPSRVYELLLASKERMTIRANLDAHHVALDGRARLEGVAAGAVHRNSVIIGVNTGFHGAAFRRVRSARQPGKAREYSRVARSRAILNHTRRVKFRKIG